MTRRIRIDLMRCTLKIDHTSLHKKSSLKFERHKPLKLDPTQKTEGQNLILFDFDYNRFKQLSVPEPV